MTNPTIVITDCDHDSIAVEQQLADARGVVLSLAQCRTEDDVIEAAKDAVGIVVQYAPITEHVLAALPQLKAIGRYGVGIDTVDLEAATRHGVAVCNVPDYGTEDVSDHAIGLAASLARGITHLDRNLRAGDYSLEIVKPLHRINTRVFGVAGLGLIGSATARKARGLGYDVIGFDPTREVGSVTEDGVAVVSFDELLNRSDVLSLHVPLNAATQHLINADSIAKMKDGAVLVNTCRGGVVDTDAVVAALTSGKLGGAGLDVFETEPLPMSSPLFDCPTAILTPHAAWYTEESYGELKHRTLENVIDVCEGRTPRNIVNPVVLEEASA